LRDRRARTGRPRIAIRKSFRWLRERWGKFARTTVRVRRLKKQGLRDGQALLSKLAESTTRFARGNKIKGRKKFVSYTSGR
jgi:hypothetical protein